MNDEQVQLQEAFREALGLHWKIQEAKSRAKQQAITPQLGSLPAKLKLLLDQIYDELYDYAEYGTSDYDFDVDQKKEIKAGISITGELLRDFQSVTWFAGSDKTGIPYKHAGLPDPEITTHLTLIIDYLRPKISNFGLSYRSPGLFPNVELQDAVGEYLVDIVQIINDRRLTSLKEIAPRPDMILRLSDMCATLNRNFGGGSFTYRSRRIQPLQLSKETSQSARNYVFSLSTSEEVEFNGKLIVINFETERIYIRTSQGNKIGLYYDKEKISDDDIRTAANREVRVKGTVSKSRTGKWQRLYAKELSPLVP